MDFELSPEQRAFASSLDKLLSSIDTVAAARDWADGAPEAGLEIWRKLADQGVHALVVAEEDGGLGASYVDLALAHERLGYHLAVGPWIEATAVLASSLSGEDAAALAEGRMATAVFHGRALDADVADAVYQGTHVLSASALNRSESVDTTRRLFSGFESSDANENTRGVEAGYLAASAQLLGSAERVLADTVTYASQRRQFGRPIGSFQAIKHALADVRVQLDFVRPLVHGAALALDAGDAPRSVSAAKALASDAALLAARVGLQVHGAVGYTRELDLSLWVLRIRALRSAWGTPSFHRQRVLDSLLAERSVS